MFNAIDNFIFSIENIFSNLKKAHLCEGKGNKLNFEFILFLN